MPYRAWIDPDLRSSLFGRHPNFPLKPILDRVRHELPEDMLKGGSPPFPYGGMTRMIVYEWDVDGHPFRVTPLYEIDDGDEAIWIFEIGIVDLWV